MEDNETIVRKAGPDDAESLVAIYSHYVENTAVSFEYVTPSVQEFRSRIENTVRKYPYLFLWIFQGFCKEFNLIHPFDSALCFVNIRCARRGVPPLAARPSPEKFFITVSMLGNIVLCIQHLSL